MSLEEYEGKWAIYDIEGEKHYVMPLCPNCGKFIKMGHILVNGFGSTKVEGFSCKRCGEIEPERMFL